MSHLVSLRAPPSKLRSSQRTWNELSEARTTLVQRKLIDRAKGLLMERDRRSESDAYHALRKLAMDRNQRLADVARTVVEMAELLG